MDKISPSDIVNFDTIFNVLFCEDESNFLNTFIKICSSAALSPIVAELIVDFASKHSIPLTRLFPNDPSILIPIAKSISRIAFRCIGTPSLHAVLRLLHAILTSISDANSIPYHRIERLCLLCLYIPLPGVAPLSRDILSLVETTTILCPGGYPNLRLPSEKVSHSVKTRSSISASTLRKRGPPSRRSFSEN
jgi:hypothetical protein